MPIEIKELHIKINVSEDGQTNASNDKKSGGKSENLIQECLDQISLINSRKNER